LVLLLIIVAVALCVIADRVQLSLSYRAAQRRFRRYRNHSPSAFPARRKSCSVIPCFGQRAILK
jgi:hypothetical protein